MTGAGPTEARNSVQVSHRDGSSPNTEASLCGFFRCIRELDQKGNNQDWNHC